MRFLIRSFFLLPLILLVFLLRLSGGFITAKYSIVKVRTSSLALDSYEEQYMQFLKTHQSNTTSTNRNEHDLNKLQPNSFESEPLDCLQRQKKQFPERSKDPYESQYLQYFQLANLPLPHQSNYTTTATKETPFVEENKEPKVGVKQERNLVVTEEMEEEFLRMLSNEIQYKQMLGQNTYALTDIDVSLIFQRFLDSIEDSQQKNNGKFSGQSRLKGEKVPKENRKTVVVLGTHSS